MDPASPERSRSREPMVDVPQKRSRGHSGDGLLHRPNADVRCSDLNQLFFPGRFPKRARQSRAPNSSMGTTLALVLHQESNRVARQYWSSDDRDAFCLNL
jgi:hypothetical protein